MTSWALLAAVSVAVVIALGILLARRRRPRGWDPIEVGAPTPCACPCHANPGMLHARPCCRACPRCGRLFATGLAAHRASCSEPT